MLSGVSSPDSQGKHVIRCSCLSKRKEAKLEGVMRSQGHTAGESCDWSLDFLNQVSLDSVHLLEPYIWASFRERPLRFHLISKVFGDTSPPPPPSHWPPMFKTSLPEKKEVILFPGPPAMVPKGAPIRFSIYTSVRDGAQDYAGADADPSAGPPTCFVSSRNRFSH